MDNFTPEFLLLYLYGETSPEQTAEIEQAMIKDWPTREKLAVLKDSMHSLDKARVSPRLEVVLSILHYARESAVVAE